jgi:hypothetical protein
LPPLLLRAELWSEKFSLSVAPAALRKVIAGVAKARCSTLDVRL